MSIERLSRREFLQGVSIVTAGGLLAACGPKATPAPAAPTTAPAVDEPAEPEVSEPAEPEATEATAPEQVTIEYWTGWSTAHEATLTAMAEECEARHPEIKVNLTVGGPPGGGDMAEVLMARIAAGNPPDMTMVNGPVPWGIRGAVLALDDYMDVAEVAKPDAFFATALATSQFRGKTYGLPHSNQSAGIAYNAGMFEEVGVSPDPEDFPKTWDELRALSARFSEMDGDIVVRAGMVPFVPGDYLSIWLYDVWSVLNGSHLYDHDNEQYTINDEANVELLEFWLAWLDEQYGGSIEGLAAQDTWSEMYDGQAFQNKKLAMSHCGCWSLADQAGAYSDIEFEMAKFPIGPRGAKSVSASWPNWMCVPSTAAHKYEGFLLAEAFSTYAFYHWFDRVFDLPSWKEFPTDGSILCGLLVELYGEERAMKYNEFFFEYREDSIVQWSSPINDFAYESINQAFDEVMHKVKEPGQALDEVQDLVQTRLVEELAVL